jgi:DNA-directed RNA polymerase subunit RPC12/RpoP
MKRICAWCGRDLDQERPENQPRTHGLCPECRRRFFAVAKDEDVPSIENDQGGDRANLRFKRP